MVKSYGVICLMQSDDGFDKLHEAAVWYETAEAIRRELLGNAVEGVGHVLVDQPTMPRLSYVVLEMSEHRQRAPLWPTINSVVQTILDDRTDRLLHSAGDRSVDKLRNSNLAILRHSVIGQTAR